MSTRAVSLVICTLVGFVALYHLGFTSSNPHSMVSTASSDVTTLTSKLRLQLVQTSSSPPTVRVTLHNTDTSKTLTILPWDTPLDNQAVVLGIFKVTEAETGEEIPSMGLKLNRKLPPDADVLIEVAPGAKIDKEAILGHPFLPLENGKEYTVRAKGRWKSVWSSKAADVGEAQLSAMDGELGEFETDTISVKVGD